MPPRKAVRPRASATPASPVKDKQDIAKGQAGGWKDTSVNVANAFHQAREKPARALSPSEQIHTVARALSPVRFFLRPGTREEDPSFSSLGDSVSYQYEEEEAFVKAAAQVRSKRRISKDELAYRPEDSDESEAGGEGVQLESRSTRGKRDRGEGYLGMGVNFRRGTPRHDMETPQISVEDVDRRSPTPMQLLRALSPRKSPSPSFTPLPGPHRPARSKVKAWLERVLEGVKPVAGGVKLGWLRWLAAGFALLLALRLLEPLLASNEPTSFNQFAGRLTSLESSVHKLDTRVGRSETELASLRHDFSSQIQTLERDLAGVRTRLGGVEDGLKGAIDDGRLRAVLEQLLPARMPVRYVQGGLEIDPAFWVDLRKTFAGHEDVDRVVRAAVAGAGSGSGSGSGKMPDLAAFEERLAARFGRDQAQTANKAWFIDTLERELVTLRNSFDEKLRLAKALNAPVKTKGGADLVPFLQDLVDAAILKYSKDTLARADFALHSAGARVIPSITSDTLTVRQPSTFGKWVLGRKAVEGHPPAMALHPDSSVGSCWPFEGAKGQLGVLLANRIRIEAVSVEHAPGELVTSVASAPKEIEIWGLIEGEENREKARDYREARPQESSPSDDYLLLATVAYDPASAQPIQTYPLEAALIDLDIDVGIVIVKVLDNWGADYTCLYRVRVHGQV